jgi:cytochrome P450
MLPAFHRERIEAAHAIMAVETRQALDRVSADTPFDLYRFTRELALRIAMRALFGLDPDRARAGGLNAAHEFEQALGFWAHQYLVQILRGRRRGGGCPRARLDALLSPRSIAAALRTSVARTSSAC